MAASKRAVSSEPSSMQEHPPLPVPRADEGRPELHPFINELGTGLLDRQPAEQRFRRHDRDEDVAAVRRGDPSDQLVATPTEPNHGAGLMTRQDAETDLHQMADLVVA